jgi:hypothetical protein
MCYTARLACLKSFCLSRGVHAHPSVPTALAVPGTGGPQPLYSPDPTRPTTVAFQPRQSRNTTWENTPLDATHSSTADIDG